MMASGTASGIRAIGLAIGAALMALPGSGAAQEADRAFVNGVIYTVDEAFSTASALAVKDGRFIYVGDDDGVRAHIGPNTFVVDLDGRTVIPGLHDAHVHIRYGERELYPRTPDIRTGLGEWASVERMQAVIRHALETGDGMRPAFVQGTELTRPDLRSDVLHQLGDAEQGDAMLDAAIEKAGSVGEVMALLGIPGATGEGLKAGAGSVSAGGGTTGSTSRDGRGSP